jgi:FMN phosphatase YigB (HAD superfamily)
MAKSKAVIFDLNNTLRKKSGEPRQKILNKAQKDSKKENVIIMSGETDKDRPKAENWLKEHDVDYAKLEMRPSGDSEPDEKVKADLLTKDVSRQFKVNKAYDDKSSNVKMFKKHGIKAKKV